MPIRKGPAVRIQRFVARYVTNGGNSRKAAIYAGVPAPSADSWATHQLSNPKVCRLIETALRAQHKRLEITADEVLREAYWMMKSNIAHTLDPETGAVKSLEDMPEELQRAIASIEVEEIWEWEEGEGGVRRKVQVGEVKKIKFWSKTEAVRLLGRYFKLWEDTGVLQSVWESSAMIRLVRAVVSVLRAEVPPELQGRIVAKLAELGKTFTGEADLELEPQLGGAVVESAAPAPAVLLPAPEPPKSPPPAA
jgi:phage terminase small subunit